MKYLVALVTSAALAVPGVALAAETPSTDVPDAETPAAAQDAQGSGTDVAKTAGCPVAGTLASKDPGQGAPVSSQITANCAGYPQSLDPAKAKDYLCAVTGAVQKGFADNGGELVAGHVGTVRKTAGLDQCVASTCVSNCTTSTSTPPGSPPGPGPDVLGGVLGDGTLPRTGGGELLAGLGLGVSSLGALLRRFLG